MQILENGIQVPTNSDEYNLTADLAKMGNTANIPVIVNSQAERDALQTWDGRRAVRLDQKGSMDIYINGAWMGPTTAYGVVSPSGYSATGNAIIEQKGTRRLVVVDLTIERTGGNIAIGTAWSGFGQILATAALGTSPIKYLAAWMSGGTNNAPAGISLNPATGIMSIRGSAAFTWTTGASFSVNCSYYI